MLEPEFHKAGRQEGKRMRRMKSHAHQLKPCKNRGKSIPILAAADLGDKGILQKLGPSFFLYLGHTLSPVSLCQWGDSTDEQQHIWWYLVAMAFFQPPKAPRISPGVHPNQKCDKRILGNLVPPM